MVREGKSVYDMTAEELAEHVGNLRRQGMGDKKLEQQTRKTAQASDPRVRRAFVRGLAGQAPKKK